MSDQPRKGMLPETRRLLVVVLGLLAALCLAVVTILSLNGAEVPDSLIAIAAGAVGALGGAFATSMNGD